MVDVAVPAGRLCRRGAAGRGGSPGHAPTAVSLTRESGKLGLGDIKLVRLLLRGTRHASVKKCRASSRIGSGPVTRPAQVSQSSPPRAG